MKLVEVLTVWNLLLVYETAASTVFICNYGMSKMIELTTRPPYCVVQTDKGKIRDMLLSTDSTKMKQMTDNSIEELEEACKKSQIKSPFQGGFIYPGTKWCGPGNNAQNHTDLGFHAKEDKCCRDHDKCPKFLSTGECSQGICNNSPFTRSHCDCDAAFRKCLQNVNSETANTIGAIFFNIIQVICFKERTPCTPWQRWVHIPEKYHDKCALNFKKSNRFIGSVVTTFSPRSKKATFFNFILRLLGFL